MTYKFQSESQMVNGFRTRILIHLININEILSMFLTQDF